jgi:hypothetical protein
MSTIQHTIQHTIQRADMTALDLPHEQITACKRQAVAARWAYTGELSRTQERSHATGKSPTARDPHRELNAASNVRTLAGRSSGRQTACGEESAGLSLLAQVNLSSLKQEPNTCDASA